MPHYRLTWTGDGSLDLSAVLDVQGKPILFDKKGAQAVIDENSLKHPVVTRYGKAGMLVAEDLSNLVAQQAPTPPAASAATASPAPKPPPKPPKKEEPPPKKEDPTEPSVVTSAKEGITEKVPEEVPEDKPSSEEKTDKPKPSSTRKPKGKPKGRGSK